MDLKLNIGAYCGLLWTIFGNHCDYCKELLKIYRILDCEECFTIRNAYTREICARITWAIVDEGRLFFGGNPVASDFAPGTMFNFSTCLLEGITDSVRNAIPIQQAMFPHEWMAPLKAPDTLYGRPPLGPPLTWEPPALPPLPPGGPPPTSPGQEDTRHPKIKLLMDPYLKWYNNYVNCEHSGDPHGIRKAHIGPPQPSKILPPNWPILLVLELRFGFGEMLPRTLVQVCPGPFKKGQIH